MKPPEMKSIFDMLPETFVAPDEVDETALPDALNLTGKDFALAVLNSREFRSYIVNGILDGKINSAIVTRLMDYGWGKPPDKVEVTGKDGKPIETITQVRRVVVRATLDPSVEPAAPAKYDTH